MLLQLLVIFHLCTCVSTTTLYPYGKNKGDTKFNKKNPPGFDKNQKGRFVDWTTITPIKIFGIDRTFLRIYETGVVGYTSDNLPLCPVGATNSLLPFIAAYWVQADLSVGGAVYYRQEFPALGGGSVDYAALVAEINVGQGGAIPTPSVISQAQLTSVIVITWEKMRPTFSTFVNPGHRNTFQLVIASTAFRSYVLILFDRLDYYAVYVTGYFCGQSAVVGMNEPTINPPYNFQLSAYFYLQPYNLAVFTNIKDFSNLRRYIMILDSAVTMQPGPPNFDCSGSGGAADPYCQYGIPPFFCSIRATGIYPHPRFCNLFVLCGNNVPLDVQTCGTNTVYNPWFQNCDWSGYFACNTNSFFTGTFSSDPQGSQRNIPPNPLISIRNDITKYTTIAFHNNTCFGVPEWKTIEDPSSCEFSLMCSNTRTYRMSCPLSWDLKRLYYNPGTDRCDYRHKVNCINGVRPPIPTTTFRPRTTTTKNATAKTFPTKSTKPISTEECQEFRNGNAIDLSSCAHYYACQDGKVLARFECQKTWNGEQLWYNPNNDYCDYPHNVAPRHGCTHLTPPATEGPVNTFSRTTTEGNPTTTSPRATTGVNPNATSPRTTTGWSNSKPTTTAAKTTGIPGPS